MKMTMGSAINGNLMSKKAGAARCPAAGGGGGENLPVGSLYSGGPRGRGDCCCADHKSSEKEKEARREKIAI